MKAKSEMAWAKSHFDQFIGKYEMNEEAVRKLVPVSKSELPPHVADGLFGAQGNVVIVSDHEKLMALKIIKTNKFDSDVSASYAQDPLIIQKSLSDLHAAPQLYGVVPQEALLKWMDQHPNGMDTYGFPSSARVKYGVLMELLEAPSIKLKRTLTDSGFKSPQDQVRAKELSNMVNDLGIRAQDMDYIYNLSGELMLIDFDYYAIRATHP